MKIWKRLLGVALCLCTVLCAMYVSADASEAQTHSHPICGSENNISKCTDPEHIKSNDHESVTWTAWNGTTEITYTNNIAYVYLTDDVTWDSASRYSTLAYEVPAKHTLYLCLNGKTLTVKVTVPSGEEDFKDEYRVDQIFSVEGNLILSDCGSNGTLTRFTGNTNSVLGLGVRVKSGGTFTMYGGTISGNKSSSDGGGVGVLKGGKFKMYGGTITGNESKPSSGTGDGGGVCVQGNFEMYGGTITGNTASGKRNGGGVGINGGTFIMHDGTITNNTAAGNGNADGGGGVYVGSTFEMKGGTISGNKTAGKGGGVYVGNFGTFKVEGNISITGNTSGCQVDATTGAFSGGTNNNVYLQSVVKPIIITGKLEDTVCIEVTTSLTPPVSISTGPIPVKIATAESKYSAYAAPKYFTYTNKTEGGEDIPLTVIPKTGGVDLVACVHSWRTDWSTDSTNHWHVCDICNGKNDVAAHTYNQEVVNEGYKASDATCTSGTLYYKSCVCGQSSTTETFEYGEKNPGNHSGTLGGWQSNDDSHWKEYSCCHTKATETEGAHDWNDGTVTTPATCTTPGEKTSTCNVCSKTKTEPINANGHSPSADWTSDNDGHWHTCANCTEKLDYAAHTGGIATCTDQAICGTCNTAYGTALDHSWGDVSYTWNADNTECTAERVCSRDGNHKETETATAVTTVMQNATCTLPELTTYTATFTTNAAFITQTKENVQTKNALGHTWGDVSYTWSEDNTECTAERVCSRDGSHEETETVTAVTTVTREATCTLPELTTYTATFTTNAAFTVQTKENVQTADALDHDWADATCTEPKTCKRDGCGATDGDALGHEWGRWVVTKPATEDAAGRESRVCRRDSSHLEMRRIPKLTPADDGCSMDDDCPLTGYGDLTPTAWYHDGVHYCIENGLMQGVSTGEFQPGGPATRAQLVMILWRLEGRPEAAGTSSFSDVADGAWYAEAVRWAAENGVVKGYDNGCFGPNDTVTREQMVTILYRYAQYKGRDVSAGEGAELQGFTDAAEVSGYAEPAMRWACGAELMTGIAQDGGMALAPKDTTTRAQVATLMLRFLK